MEQYLFENGEKVAALTASPAPGAYYTDQHVRLRSAAPDAAIHYTLDGSEPSVGSTRYSGPIAVKRTTTIKAVAIRPEDRQPVAGALKGQAVSETATFRYEFESRETIASRFLSFTYRSMPYRLYIPAQYEPGGEPYPLVLFLHGGAERGDDNERQLLASDGAVIWAAPEHQAANPSFVLAPQARNVPGGGFGLTRDAANDDVIELSRVFEVGEDVRTAVEIVRLVAEQYGIDRDRLYVTGLSQGGFGTFHTYAIAPDLFAAMVPIAGGGDPDKMPALAGKPIWAFHAEDDAVIPVSYTREAIERIREAGGAPIYTEYAADLNYNHGSWVPAYANKQMIEWLFRQRKQG
ncbi:chitobiase/beta-hexosaminidase C-terminal domain-containing protein [Paenibacillus arenilitoris]|uniref:Chitobiase/beta-hexosaminidase C-terminal domain-containing protein n=1 Tax=Paenibacillus arenilitoris TaxID=2772299 RepID=A0A927H3X9_9BACL|nr:chitobiase/beta-hexosaminidase C-terminal domain-containing protein [Paenibacillus arenilitoris]MBD2867826.1 chitobiase/beta-hexosaminidase C-terminal domain-containing protein [Paenibacillus arenilitoris]